MVGKRSCMARITRTSTVPSPTPASNTRTAGGRGWMLASSSETRCATTHFSLQVFTNSRYFCRLSKKRKLRAGRRGREPAPAAAASPARAGGRAARRAAARGGSPLPFAAMKARMRSRVSVVMRPPLRRRLASLPSLTARRPKVDSASPCGGRNRRSPAGFVRSWRASPKTTSGGRLTGSEPSRALRVKCWERWAR